MATLEEIEAEIARRSSTAALPAGPSLQDVEAEIARRQAQQAPQTEEPGILSQAGSFLFDNVIAPVGETLNEGLNVPGAILQDFQDIKEQGFTKTDSFPFFELPESIGQRREDSGEAIMDIAPFMLGGGAPTLATGARGVGLRALGSGLGSGAASVGQQAQDGEGFDPYQTAAAMALGGAGQAGGEMLAAGVPLALRGLVRGGERGRNTMQAAIADAARVNQTPTLAQATQSSFLDSLESFLAKAPGSAGNIRDQVRATTAGVRESLERLAQGGSSRVFDAETAGQAVIGGVDDFVARFQNRAGPLFDRITDSVGADTAVPVANTIRNLSERIAPIAGAERTGQRFTHPFIRGLADDLLADAGDTGSIPFQALQRVRSLVGEQLSSPSLSSDIPTAQLRQLYGAISDDIRTAAASAGPDAAQAFSRANNFYRAGQQRLQGTLEPLVKNKTPEKVFQSLVSGVKTGPTQIRTLMRSLSPDQGRVVTGSVIRRLGTANPGQQGAEGADFSFQTFLTRWNQIDGKARDELFRRGASSGLGDDINAIARYAERVTESSKAFANPSGTSGATIGTTAALLGAGSVVASPLLGVGALTLPLILAGGAGTANVAGRMMTSPRVVNWLARATELGADSLPAHLRRLTAIAAKEQPEVQEAIAGYLEMLDSPIGGAEAAEAPAAPAAPAVPLQRPSRLPPPLEFQPDLSFMSAPGSEGLPPGGQAPAPGGPAPAQTGFGAGFNELATQQFLKDGNVNLNDALVSAIMGGQGV